MKAVERAKLVRSLWRLRLLVLVIGFFLVTVTFVVLSKPDALLFNLNGRLSVDDAPRSHFEDAEANGKVTAVEEEKRALTGSDPQQSAKKGHESQLLGELAVALESLDNFFVRCPSSFLPCDPIHGLQIATDLASLKRSSTSSFMCRLYHLLGSGGEGEKKGHRKVTLPTVSNYTIRDVEDSDKAKQQDSKPETENKLEMVAGKSDGS